MEDARWYAAICFATVMPLNVTWFVLTKSGRQNLTAILIPTCCWFVGTPLSLVFGNAMGMHVGGLWLGLCIGYSLCSLLLYICVRRSDWPKLSAAAQERAEVTDDGVVLLTHGKEKADGGPDTEGTGSTGA